MAINDFLGRSTLSETGFTLGGKVKTVQGVDNVGQQIARALAIPKGSALGAREQGSDLYKLQFQPADDITFALMQTFIKDTVAAQVPNAEKLRLVFERQSPGAVKVTISFSIKKTAQSGAVSVVLPVGG
jgi:phage baseplate assembly protein W